MIQKIQKLAGLIGRTPLFELESENIRLFTKLEYRNLSGSIKDRAAYSIIVDAIRQGTINEKTRIIESSSGNMAIALATICSYINLEFIPVIDSNVNEMNERMLRVLCKRVEKITERDDTGGFLLNRIKRVKEICAREENIFWTNQFGNPNNYLGYYHSLAVELGESPGQVDHIFVAVSSGGTITGLSKRLKEIFPAIRVIAVDVEGSMIFSNHAKNRKLSGLGASKIPEILAHASIDEVMILTEDEIIEGCKLLSQHHSIFAGASSGACYRAILKYFDGWNETNRPTVVFCCPDKGNGYMDSVFESESQLEKKQEVA